jgi:hypothetical protein
MAIDFKLFYNVGMYLICFANFENSTSFFPCDPVFMKRLPFFFILFSGALGAVSFALHHFLMQGYVIELGVLKPYYTPWLNGKGIKNADLFFGKEMKGSRRWVLGARNIQFQGGSLENIRLSLGWVAGGICIHHIDMLGLSMHLNQMLDSGGNHFSPLVFFPLIVHGSGSIKNVTLLAALPQWAQKKQGCSVEKKSKKRNKEDGFYSNDQAMASFWNVGWEKGKIRMDSVRGAPESGFIHAKDKNRPVICLDIHQNKTGGDVEVWIHPVTINGKFLGLPPFSISGNGKAKWKTHPTGMGNWSIQWALKQHGKSVIPGGLFSNSLKNTDLKNTSKNQPGIVVSNGSISGVKSDQSSMDISAKIDLDDAQIYAQCTGTSASNFVIKTGIKHGAVSVSTLHQLWPEIPETELIRQWILNHIHRGSISKASVVITKKDTGKAKGDLDYHGTFELKDLGLSIKPEMPTIHRINAVTVFNKKECNIAIRQAVMDRHTSSGRVTISLGKSSPVLKLDVSLTGPLATLIPILLQWSGHKSVDIRQVKGVALTHIKGQFPLKPVISDHEIHLDLHSDIPKAGFHLFLGAHDIHVQNTHLVIDHCQKESSITGKGLVNHIPVQWVWKADIFQFSSHPNAAHIVAFSGLPVAPYLQGQTRVRGSCKKGLWDIDVDFSRCACALPWLDWKKPVGKKLGIHVKKSDKTWGITMKGDDVSGQVQVDCMASIPITTQIYLGKTFFRYAFTSDHQAGHWKNLWNILQNGGHHQLFFRAPVLKLPAWKDKKEASHKKLPPDGAPPSIPDKKTKPIGIDLDFACDAIRFQTITMDQVHLQLSGSASSIIPKSGNLLNHFLWSKGSFYSVHRANNVKRKKTGYLSILWKPLQGGTSRILAEMVDVGSVCNGLGITQRIRGGDLYLDATQNTDGGYMGNIHVDQIKTKLGALGKLLTSISPTLFTELFSSGVLFNQVDADFSYSSGELKLKNTVAKGINLGLLLKGTVDIRRRQFKLQGVSVPSYLINTFFSNFPVVGWLLGGKKGLLSSEFKITGPWNNPKITTVPLSVFKLGFLKNIPLFKKSKKGKK